MFKYSDAMTFMIIIQKDTSVIKKGYNILAPPGSGKTTYIRK